MATPVGNIIARLIRAGYPEGTARKIASGELSMDEASRMARAREQGYDVFKTYYHGTPYAEQIAQEGFAPRTLGQGNDQYGPGFYFTSDPHMASGYAVAPPGRPEATPGVIEAFLRSNPSRAFDTGSAGMQITLNQRLAEKLIEKAPNARDLDGPLSNFFEASSPSGYTEGDVKNAASYYIGQDAETLLGDIYGNDAESFLSALTDVTGIDSIEVLSDRYPGASVKTVFDPSQVRSPNAAYDPEQTGSSNILAGLAPYAVPTVLGGSILGAAMTPEKAKAAGFGTLAKTIGRATLRAYTGSPAKFTRPSMQSVGTGEGNQAFGYGLYFSDSPQIAGGYRRGVSSQKVIDRMSERYDLDELDFDSVNEMLNAGQFSDEDEKLIQALKDADYLGFDSPAEALRTAFSPDINAFDTADPAINRLQRVADEVGFLYEVEVPGENFIDWNLPLGEQPELVQQVVMENVKSPALRKRIEDGSFRGSDAYNIFGNNPQTNSMKWAQYGVPGVRYESYGRATRRGDMQRREGLPNNYVIFDENLINVVRRNDEALENNFDEMAARISASNVRRPLAAVLGGGAAASQAGEVRSPLDRPEDVERRANARAVAVASDTLERLRRERGAVMSPLLDTRMARFGDYLTENRPSEMDPVQRALQSLGLFQGLGEYLRTTGEGQRTRTMQDINAALDVVPL